MTAHKQRVNKKPEKLQSAVDESVGTATKLSTTSRQPGRRSTHKVTLGDVALHARVSPQTVSRSVRSPQLVSPATLKRVQESIAAMGYVPNITASNLASNRSMTVVAIIPSISATIFADAVHGLDDVLSPHGYQLFIGATDYHPDREEELIRAFLGRRPDGVFIIGTAHTDGASKLLSTAGIPVVETWDLTERPIHSMVGFSNDQAIRAIMRYVKSKGYLHPTFGGSLQPGDSRVNERRRSFEGSIQDLFPGEQTRVVDSGPGLSDLDTGKIILDRTLREFPETDVLVFPSDVLAVGAILDCSRRGISVPGRLAITGFGDFDIARHVIPRLTTVAVPNREIGTRAGAVLLKCMSDPKAQPEAIDLAFTIVARESA